MPKIKRYDFNLTENTNKKQKNIETDLNKSLFENVQNRINYWQSIEKEIKILEEKLKNIEKELKLINDIPENRSKISDLKVEIYNLENKILRLKRSNDNVEYFFCISNLIKENESNINLLNNEKNIKVLANGPLKPRIKKKKSTNNENIYFIKSISTQLKNHQLFSGNVGKVEYSKKLAQYLHEIPIETNENKYCTNPNCFSCIMQYNEKPPSIYCPNCGLSIEVLDNTSISVHDKEIKTNLPFTYRPKLHFMSWVRRITGKLKFNIPQWVKDEVYYKLFLRKITNVNLVTWEVVDDIIRLSAKTDSRFSDYYPHVYQITNIIRGKAILTFTDEEEQEIFEYFDPIYALWESKKHLFNIERYNFMYNALVLQIIFMILNYPTNVIVIFNMIKGNSNLKFYDDFIKMICKELGEKSFTTSELEIMKYGKGTNILDELKKLNTSMNSEIEENAIENIKINKIFENNNILKSNLSEENNDKLKEENINLKEINLKQNISCCVLLDD